MKQLRIFISSVQKEFEPVRRDLKVFLLGDAVLRRFISDVFLFEELPASDRRADAVYLEEVERCDIYLGLLGYEYGGADSEGISPTEREYDYATKNHKTRLIYVWGSDESRRAPAMKKLVQKASSELIRRRIEGFSALTSEVYSSLVDHLDRNGALRVPPFDRSGSSFGFLRLAVKLETKNIRKSLAFPNQQRHGISIYSRVKGSCSRLGRRARARTMYFPAKGSQRAQRARKTKGLTKGSKGSAVKSSSGADHREEKTRSKENPPANTSSRYLFRPLHFLR